MEPIKVFVETGNKKTFAGAVEWPGWSRSGRDESTALKALLDYGPRYAQVLDRTSMQFQPPNEAAEFVVIERHKGNATTDFGSPAAVLDGDKEPLKQDEHENSLAIVAACWQAFDEAVQRATGRELRKGPRGGGRDLDKIIEHVIEADRAYLGRLAYRTKREAEISPVEALGRTRGAIVDALDVAVNKGLPEKGPRGGTIWPPRYFVRRVAWHVLDHAWEIEDRTL